MNFTKVIFTNDHGKIDAEFRRSIAEIFCNANLRFTQCKRAWFPHVDIYESLDGLVVNVEIAGVKKEDIFIEVNSNLLKIYGKRERPLMKNKRYSLAEIPYGYFERNISLPVPVNTDSVSATYADGLLQITMAKLPIVSVHKVRIKSGI